MEDIEDSERLFRRLFDTCCVGTVEEVRLLLPTVDDLNESWQGNPLLVAACLRKEETERLAVLELLIDAGASTVLASSALARLDHCSSAIIAKLIHAVPLGEDALLEHLKGCRARSPRDKEAVKVLEVLVNAYDALAVVQPEKFARVLRKVCIGHRWGSFEKDVCKREPLLMPLQKSRHYVESLAQLVAMSRNFVKDPRERDQHLKILTLCCTSRWAGADNLRELLKIELAPEDYSSAFQHCCRHGDEEMVALLLDARPSLAAEFQPLFVLQNVGDPLGVLRAVSHHISLPELCVDVPLDPSSYCWVKEIGSWESKLVQFEDGHIQPEVVWACLKVGWQDVLKFPQDPTKEQQTALVLHDSLFEAAQKGDVAKVLELMSRNANPFLIERKNVFDFSTTYHNSLAIDVASTEMRPILRDYMSWRPCRARRHWFGPGFEKRAVTLLLILRHHPIASNIPRELRNMMVQWLARSETLSVMTCPTKGGDLMGEFGA